MPARKRYSRGFHSAAVWMIFGGLIIGAAVQETGFGHTLASGLLRIFPRSYFGILCGITVVGTVLCFIIPSNTGRIVIMMPIFMALADQVASSPEAGAAPGWVSRSRPVPFIRASQFYLLPSPISAGWARRRAFYRIKFTYAEYLIANFPVIGIVLP